jgi:hypothetical protein
MLEWFKNRLNSSLQVASSPEASKLLIKQLEPLEQVPGSTKGLADRLTRFVLNGEPESAVVELSALKGTSHRLLVSVAYYGGGRRPSKRDLAALVTVLPEDPELYLRLALVFDAAHETGAGVVQYLGFRLIPAVPDSLSWLTTFLIQLSDSGQERFKIFPTKLLSAMIAATGADPNVLVRGAFFYDDAKGKSQISRWTSAPFNYFECLDGFVDVVLNSSEIVRPAFRQKDAVSRACVLRAFEALGIPCDRFVDELAALAVSGSKEVREAALPLISKRFSLFSSAIKTSAGKGSSEERYQAVRLLTSLGSDDERVFLAQRLEVEKSAKVSEVIQSAIADQSNEQSTIAEDNYVLPPAPKVDVYAPLDKQILTELRVRVEQAEKEVAEAFARNQYVKTHNWTRAPIARDTADRLFDALQNFVVKDAHKYKLFEKTHGVDAKLLRNFAIPPQFQLIHLVRWCLLVCGGLEGNNNLNRATLGYRWSQPLRNYQKVQRKAIDLRELAAVFRTLGLDDGAIGRQILQSNRYFSTPFLRVVPDATWPYFAERPDLLEEALGLKKTENESPYANFWEQDERQNAFNILKTFPRLPVKMGAPLWDIALGGGKTERPWAQDCLAGVTNKEAKIIAALASRQQDARLAAAQWLCVLGHTEAIPALRLALSKEKSEIVKDELIKTLETMGVKLDELLDLDKLDQEAERGLKKGIPKDLEWFPFEQLPIVTWADSGKPVPAEILRWFLVQGHKLNNAEANPALRRYCSLFQKDGREKLGKFVMETWIAQDTKPTYTPEEAAARAEREAQQMAAYAKQYPKYYPDFDQQRAYQASFNRLLVQPEGSQTSTKGILAVSGACCGGEAAPIVHRYVKQWYGYRGAQCKALLQVLAWVDHPSATQVILSVANRFRTKGIQEEAMRQCQLLAQRKGWTLDELADRTIPTAGFDETGSLELDFGPRKFTAGLSEEMTIAVSNPNGKTIASLPDANQSDDADKAKQAKSALSNARKELKTVLTMQRDRLYEALCTQRTWRFEDWDNYLRQHPIVGRYCQRLVWVAFSDDKIVESFRPLGDGTLTNHQDDEVKLDPETSVRLGHDQTLPAEDCAAWLQHFSDYKVEPLFQQFGKATFTLPEDMKESSEIKDFLGHVLKAFSLRNRLTRLGYTRGAAQDGGWFFEYSKTFLGLGIQAIIEFTGNGLPEENRVVALQRLYFERKFETGSSTMSEGVTLGELPRVLLAECWNDIRMASTEGSGFAEDWEKQTEM